MRTPVTTALTQEVSWATESYFWRSKSMKQHRILYRCGKAQDTAGTHAGLPAFSRRRSGPIAVAAAVALALSGSAALAQQASEDEGAQASRDAETQDSAEVDRIVVTGSRVPRADVTSNSPVNVLDAEEFQLSGAVEVEDLLDTLPQVVGTFGASSNNPGNGTATVDLRGLGAERIQTGRAHVRT